MERPTRYKTILYATCVGALSALLSTSSAAVNEQQAGAAPSPHYGGEYRAPLPNEPVTLDPARYGDINSMAVGNNLFDGLVQFDENVKVVPAIASVWKISRDQRTYTFMLRRGVKFHNGRDVTAEDFVFSFTRILDPQTKSPAAELFANVKGADAFRRGENATVVGLKALSDYVFTIELERPFAPFLSILAMANAKVVPREALGPDFNSRPVGTGPFRFKSWQPGVEVVLDANPGYYADRPYLDRLRFRIYTNGGYERSFSDFQAGLLEHTRLRGEQYDQVAHDDSSAYKIVTKPGLNIVYVGINTRLTPLDNVQVRQAINYAVDTDAITRSIARRGRQPVSGLLPPGIIGFNPDFKGYGYDPQRARRLLAEAGYPQGKGFPTIELWTVSKSSNVYEQLEAYRQYLAEVGLTVEIRVAENWTGFKQAIRDDKAHLFYIAWYADYPDPDNFLYTIAHSSGSFNLMRYSNPDEDVLLEKARTEQDPLSRVQLYQEIEQRVMQAAPIIPQHVNSSSYLFRDVVHGVAISRLGEVYLPFHKIWLTPAPQPL